MLLMLMAKVHTNPKNKAKASHRMILYLHKNYFDNNKLIKNKHIYKNKSAAVKTTWNKQTKSVASSSTLRDLKLNLILKQIEKITFNDIPMTIVATTTENEENLNMSQVNTTPEMAMA